MLYTSASILIGQVYPPKSGVELKSMTQHKKDYGVKALSKDQSVRKERRNAIFLMSSKSRLKKNFFISRNKPKQEHYLLNSWLSPTYKINKKQSKKRKINQ